MNTYILNLLPSLKSINSSIHGLLHWKRVARNGKYLSDLNNADYAVVKYFAYLHDSQRLNDGDDLEHGYRAKVFIQSLIDQSKLADLTDTQQKQLMYACEYHSQDNIWSDDITILTCIDSDRLDLTRLGIQPDPCLLFTEFGKKLAIK